MKPGALRSAAAFAPLLLVAIPLFAVTIPPSADLPQHVAQIRLFHEALGAGADTYRINWLGPNNLVYVLLGAMSAVFSPITAGRVSLLFLLLAWVGATAWLAHRRGRPPESAVLAGVLIFQGALYGGFLNFLTGWPIFVLWFDALSRPSRRWLRLTILATLLYEAHVLWLAIGVAWMVVVGIVTRSPLRIWTVGLTSLVPAAILSAIAYPQLVSIRSRFDTAPYWNDPIWTRLSPTHLPDELFGGIRGPVEAMVTVCLAGWIVCTAMTRWRDLRAGTDGLLLLAAFLIGAIAILAPDKYMNTIHFSDRWMPVAAALLLIGLPSPRIGTPAGWILALCPLSLMVAETTFFWTTFERTELRGLQEAVDAVPANARVLGLDLTKDSAYIKGRPFLQEAAWAQAERGGSLGFSFAEHGSGMVSYRQPRPITWTPALEWFAENAKSSDVGQFDYVISNGMPDRKLDLSPVTMRGRWWLYRVRR